MHELWPIFLVVLVGCCLYLAWRADRKLAQTHAQSCGAFVAVLIEIVRNLVRETRASWDAEKAKASPETVRKIDDGLAAVEERIGSFEREYAEIERSLGDAADDHPGKKPYRKIAEAYLALAERYRGEILEPFLVTAKEVKAASLAAHETPPIEPSEKN